MRAMTHIIYGVVVVVIHIVAVIRKVRATIPKVVGQVDVMVVDARVDDSHHNTFTRIAQFPNLVGMDLDDILRDFAGSHCGSGFLSIGNPVVFPSKTNDFDVVAIRQILNGRLGGIEIQGIGHPQDNRLCGHVVALHLGQRMTKVVLRSIGKRLQLVDNKLTTLGAVDIIVGTTVHLCPIVL